MFVQGGCMKQGPATLRNDGDFVRFGKCVLDYWREMSETGAKILPEKAFYSLPVKQARTGKY
jgi:hypothetical protein